MISFNTFLDTLPAFTCARAVGNLSKICLEVTILISSPFCCLIKSRIVLTILLFFSDFYSQEFLYY